MTANNLQSLLLFINDEPSFNIWTSMFLFVSLQALFVSIALFFMKGVQFKANNLLGILLLCFSVVLFSWVLYWTGFNTKFPFLNHLYHILPYLTGPLIFIYVRILIREQKLSISDVVHFIPAIIISFLLAPFILINFSIMDYESIPKWWMVITFNWFTKVILLCIYVLLTYNVTKSVDNQEWHKKKWVKYLLIGLIGYTIALISYYILVRFKFFNPAWDYAISFALSFFIFIVSIMGYLQPRVFEGESVKEILKSPAKYEKTGLTKKAEFELRDKLEEAMIIDQLYTNGNLRLVDLAEFVGANRHHVSLVINKHFKENYFEFLNRHRVQHVMRLIQNPKYKKEPLIQLAYQAGFNNKVSFNKAFKKTTNLTPSTYRKQTALQAKNE